MEIIQRNKKFILKGKKVIYNYPIINKHKFNVKPIQEIRNDNNTNVQYEYSFSDEDE